MPSRSRPTSPSFVGSDHVEVQPEFAQAALRQGVVPLFVAWCLLRDAAGGRGVLERADGNAVLAAGRNVSAHRVAEMLRQGEGTFWTTKSDGRIWLLGAAKLAALFEVAWVGRSQLVPRKRLGGSKTQLRATLAATVYQTDGSGPPLSRRVVAEVINVSPASQRRWENQYGSAKKVTEVYVELSHVKDPEHRAELAAIYGGWGFFCEPKGALYRRHGDIRQTVDHLPGSRASARRLNRQLTRGASPASQTRGERALRVNFLLGNAASSLPGAKAWMRCPRALGKKSGRREAFDPVLDYSVLEVITPWGTRKWESLFDPYWDEDFV